MNNVNKICFAFGISCIDVIIIPTNKPVRCLCSVVPRMCVYVSVEACACRPIVRECRCLYVCLPACLPACLPTCLPVSAKRLIFKLILTLNYTDWQRSRIWKKENNYHNKIIIIITVIIIIIVLKTCQAHIQFIKNCPKCCTMLHSVHTHKSHLQYQSTLILTFSQLQQSVRQTYPTVNLHWQHTITQITRLQTELFLEATQTMQIDFNSLDRFHETRLSGEEMSNN